MDQQYAFEIVFLGYSIWVLHRVLHGVPKWATFKINFLTTLKCITTLGGPSLSKLYGCS